MGLKYSGSTAINWIASGSVGASAPANTQVPISLTLVLGQSPVSDYRVFKGQVLEIDDLYTTTAGQSPDGYIQIVIDNIPQPFAIDLNSLYIGNQNKPKLPVIRIGENHVVQFYIYTNAANGTTATTLSFMVKGKILSA